MFRRFIGCPRCVVLQDIGKKEVKLQGFRRRLVPTTLEPIKLWKTRKFCQQEHLAFCGVLSLRVKRWQQGWSDQEPTLSTKIFLNIGILRIFLWIQEKFWQNRHEMLHMDIMISITKFWRTSYEKFQRVLKNNSMLKLPIFLIPLSLPKIFLEKSFLILWENDKQYWAS